MIIDTKTLAKASGHSVRTIQRLASSGYLKPVPVHTGLNGRPTQWFDLDTCMALLDARVGRVVN